MMQQHDYRQQMSYMNNTTGGKRNRAEIIIDREFPRESQYEGSEGDILSESRVVENALVTEPQASCQSKKHYQMQDYLATNRDSSGRVVGATDTMVLGQNGILSNNLNIQNGAHTPKGLSASMLGGRGEDGDENAGCRAFDEGKFD